MALVTKKSLYEAVEALLEGGSPSAGKKFEPEMVQAHIQQAINRKLKIEYLSATLPGDETIPDGLILACYNDIPVGTYKGLSRAVLPAQPISLRKNMGIYFVGPAAGGNIVIDPVTSTGPVVITIESVIGTSVSITGTEQVVTGLADGSTVVNCAALGDYYVDVIRGNIPIPGINPTDGSNYFTKVLASPLITFSSPLVAGEYVKIQTRLGVQNVAAGTGVGYERVATFAAISSSTAPRFIEVNEDETNNGDPTLYRYNAGQLKRIETLTP